jgi:hypothetical protein
MRGAGERPDEASRDGETGKKEGALFGEHENLGLEVFSWKYIKAEVRSWRLEVRPRQAPAIQVEAYASHTEEGVKRWN